MLINKNSNFESIDLPYQAQLSSINDIIVDDYNNDGNIDLLVAGNLFTSEVEPAISISFKSWGFIFPRISPTFSIY